MSLKKCIIVPTFSLRSSEIINELILKLNSQSIDSADIIVINNNTTPIILLEKSLKGSVVILNGIKNLGSGGGFYLGMKYAYNKGYDYYFLADDDASFFDAYVLQKLLDGAISGDKVITCPFWKEKSLDINISPSFSCYGCFSHKVLLNCGFYSPLFVYGGEDSAYATVLTWKNYSVKEVDTFILHPVKNGLTLSRGSSGLSVYRSNSILQHYWHIYYAPTILLKLKYLLLANLYIFTLIYGIIFFKSEFKIQHLLNLRNIIVYIPPILLKSTGTFFYPKYRNSSYDSICETSSGEDVYIYDDSIGFSLNKKNIVFTSWFPAIKLSIGNIIKAFFHYDSFGLLNNHDEINNIVTSKIFFSSNHMIGKILVIMLSILLTLPIIILTIGLASILLIKYLFIIFLLEKNEECLFKNFVNIK